MGLTNKVDRIKVHTSEPNGWTDVKERKDQDEAKRNLQVF
jgi:hypothetical protein